MQERNVTVLKKGERLKEKYIIEDVLGEGGFGITYSGYDEILNIRVAIKEYFPHALVTRNNEFTMSVSVSQTKYLDSFEYGSAHDALGATAVEGIENMLKQLEDPEITSLWKSVTENK